MTFNYTFLKPDEREKEPPTIQEAFFEIYWETDSTVDGFTRFHLACDKFTEAYGLKPPYVNHNSFTSMMTRRMRQRRI